MGDVVVVGVAAGRDFNSLCVKCTVCEADLLPVGVQVRRKLVRSEDGRDEHIHRVWSPTTVQKLHRYFMQLT